MSDARPRRVGLYGGSFDPVHDAHLALARTALEHLQLDELRWVPVGQAWQKSRPLTERRHRAAMIDAAIEGEPRYVLDRSELDRDGPSYTIDTVEQLRAQQPGADWFLVIGEDQYRNLPTWHRWQQLVDRVTLAVARRASAGGLPPAGPLIPPPELSAHPHRVLTLPMPPTPISSTTIREAAAAGNVRGYVGLVPPAVAGYIARHHLYLPEAR